MDEILAALRAVAEPTRLRILKLCAEGELTVSELVAVLGQSQPRVSRHLKLMCDAGLLDRLPEGSWVFHRLAAQAPARAALAEILAALPEDDPLINGDAQRLQAIKQARAATAAAYFDKNARHWALMRSLHVDEAEVEAALTRIFATRRLGDLLDIGTGTGRVLEVLGHDADRAEGVDLSRDMLAVARARLDGAGLARCSVRQADMYALPFADASFDSVTIHQVLHFADRPAAVVAEAARVLRPGGTLVVVDFAPHRLEELRDRHEHRRLGFADVEVGQWCRDAGLVLDDAAPLAGDPLTVVLWVASRPTQPACSRLSLAGEVL